MTSANEELKKILTEYRDTYRVMCEASRDRAIKTLGPGSRVPERGRLYGDDAKAAFDEKCLEYKARVEAITGARAADLKRKMTEAPSSEAVATLTVLNMRKNVTKEEIQDLVERYGDNPQSYKAIVGIAREHDIRGFEDHPVETEFRDVVDLEHALSKNLCTSEAEKGRASDGFLSMLGMQIDEVFPSEE